MKRFKIIIAAMAVALQLVVVANAFTADKGRNKKMGYCFDAAFHEKTNRLYVAAGPMGTHVFEVTKGKFNYITTVYGGGYHRNLKISGDRAYLADGKRGLVVFDITEKIPVCTWKQPDQNVSGMGIDLHDNRAYLAAGAEGLHIFDVSNPDSPKRVGTCKTNADAWDVWVSGNYAYVADLQKGLTVVDVSQPSQLRMVSLVTWDKIEPMAEIIRGEGQMTYVAAGKHGLVALDVSNPLDPHMVSKYKSGPGGFGEGLCVRNSLVYLSNGNQENKDENGLIIIDAQNPHSLKVKGICTFRGWVEGVCLVGHHAFVTNTYSGIRSIEVSDPNNPRLVDSFGPMEEEKKDPLLSSKMSPEEAQVIEKFYKIREEILAGRGYDDASTPLATILSVLSSVHFRDTGAFKRNLAMDFDKMGRKVTDEDMASLEEILVQHDILRAPLPPARPEEGTFWPIYVKSKGGTELTDTLITIFWKGKWMYVGNLGSTTMDWREAIPKIQELLKKHGK
ncbi:MAG: LVIVD repeat-containing protein [Phycisphaerae bacterium]